MKPAHIMFRVRSEKRSVSFYGDIFKMKVVRRAEFDEFTHIFLQDDTSDLKLKLCVREDQEGDYDLGKGYGHIGFMVENVDQYRHEIDRKGYEPTKVEELWNEGELYARYFFLKDPDGYQIKVSQDLS